MASNITRHRTPGHVARVVIALGEHAALETQVQLGHRLRYVASEEMKSFEALSASVGQLAHASARSLDTGS